MVTIPEQNKRTNYKTNPLKQKAMTRRTNKQSFEATVNGRKYEFCAYTTSTRYGFCHTVQTWCDYRNIATDTKQSYYNRTWERFDYETALSAAIKKCPKEDRDELRAVLIDRKAQAEHEKAEAFIGAFSRVWSQVSDANKKRIASAAGMVETPEQANAVMSAAKMAVALQALE